MLDMRDVHRHKMFRRNMTLLPIPFIMSGWLSSGCCIHLSVCCVHQVFFMTSSPLFSPGHTTCFSMTSVHKALVLGLEGKLSTYWVIISSNVTENWIVLQRKIFHSNTHSNTSPDLVGDLPKYFLSSSTMPDEIVSLCYRHYTNSCPCWSS